MAKCLEKLGDSFNAIRMDARAVKPVPPDRLVKLDLGVVTPATQFAKGRIMPLGKRYKKWTKANNIEWVSKGNNPVLYEREFLNTLQAKDFTGIKDLTGKGVAGAAEASGINAAKDAVLKTLKQAGVEAVAGVPVETFIEQVGVARKIKAPLATDVTKAEWQNLRLKKVKELKGGMQRQVVLEKEVGGQNRMFIKKEGLATGNPAELMYSNLAEELGMTDLVPKITEFTTGKGQFVTRTLRQEFVPSKIAMNHPQALADTAIRDFILNEKKGRDWNLLDYLFAQVDRNSGNFAFDIKRGKVKGFRLIDNNGGLLPDSIVPRFHGSPTNVPLPTATKNRYKEWLKSMGWDEKVAGSWDKVADEMKDYFAKHGLDVATDKTVQAKIDMFVGRMKAVVHEDFRMPWSRGAMRNVSAVEPMMPADIAAGTKRIEAAYRKSLKAVPESVPVETIKYTGKSPVTGLVSDVVQAKWAPQQASMKKIKPLQGGAQRPVELVENVAGEKFVQKSVIFEADASTELLYSNVAEELGMNIVPKITRFERIEPLRGGKTFGYLQQEFIPGKIAHEHGLLVTGAPSQAKPLRRFMLETKEGRDWNFLDYMFKQADRNTGNFAYEIQRGKVKGLQLIDNNGGLMKGKFIAPEEGISYLPLSDATAAKVKKWAESMGLTEARTGWLEVEKNIAKYFKLNKMPAADIDGVAEAFTRRLRVVVNADYSVPLAEGVGRYKGGYQFPLTHVEIEKGTALINKVKAPRYVLAPEKAAAEKVAAAAKAAPEKVAVPKKAAAPKKAELLVTKPLPTQAIEAEWKAKKFEDVPNAQPMSKGAQRDVKIVRDADGNKFVEKSLKQDGAHPEEMIYYNVADELGMNLVPKTAQWNRGQLGDVLVQEFVDAPVALSRFGEMQLAIEQAHLKKFVMETKGGRDWNLLDYLMGQGDRNRGNFVYNIKKGAVTDFKLIDNNSSLRPYSRHGPRGGDATQLLAIDPRTKAKLEKFMEGLGYDKKLHHPGNMRRNWEVVEDNLTKYLNRVGWQDAGVPLVDEAAVRMVASRAESVVKKLQIIVENDYKAPLADVIKNKIRPGGNLAKDLGAHEIQVADKILFEAAAPKKVAKAAVPEKVVEQAAAPKKVWKNAPEKVVSPPLGVKPLPTEVIEEAWKDKELKKVRDMSFGAQRDVTVVKDANGVKFVEKMTQTGAAHPEEMAYFNIADELGMNIVPKVTQFKRGQLGDVLVQEFAEAPAALTRTGMEALTAQRAQLRRFILEEKAGRDWNFMDYVLGQNDRNPGNFVYNIKKGKVADFKLIDNNSSLSHFEHKYQLQQGDPKQLLSLDPQTKVKVEKFVKSLGYDGTEASWETLTGNLDAYLQRNGFGRVSAPGVADNVAGRLKTVIANDYKVPFSKELAKRLRLPGEALETFTAAEVKAGDKILHKIVTPETGNVEFAKKVVGKPLKEIKPLGGGNQRLVSLEEMEDGTKVVTKRGFRQAETTIAKDIQNEILFSDFAQEMGMNVVPKIAKGKPGTVIQEFTNYPTKTSYKIPPDIMKNQIVTFMETTKPGKDWGLMDNLFGAFDRHGGNYALKMEKGKIVDVRLIDNNDLRFKAVGRNGPMVTMDPKTKEKFTGWLKDMGWSEADGNWPEVETNIRAWLKERGVVKPPTTAKGFHGDDLPGEFIGGVVNVVTNDFKYRAVLVDYNLGL